MGYGERSYYCRWRINAVPARLVDIPVREDAGNNATLQQDCQYCPIGAGCIYRGRHVLFRYHPLLDIANSSVYKQVLLGVLVSRQTHRNASEIAVH